MRIECHNAQIRFFLIFLYRSGLMPVFILKQFEKYDIVVNPHSAEISEIDNSVWTR